MSVASASASEGVISAVVSWIDGAIESTTALSGERSLNFTTAAQLTFTPVSFLPLGRVPGGGVGAVGKSPAEATDESLA
jgi:hypothetical protein